MTTDYTTLKALAEEVLANRKAFDWDNGTTEADLAYHISASPDVVLALIARVAELEEIQRLLHRKWFGHRGTWHLSFTEAVDQTMEQALERESKLEAENAALKAELAARWLPIESAPKDGTEVLVYVDGFGLMHWIDYDEAKLWIWSEPLLSDADPDPIQPTHWMPLPAAPGASPQPSQALNYTAADCMESEARWQKIAQPSQVGELSDTEMLDYLQSKGGQWVCRDSTTGRGWRLHQNEYTGSLSVRDAILAAINAKGAT